MSIEHPRTSYKYTTPGKRRLGKTNKKAKNKQQQQKTNNNNKEEEKEKRILGISRSKIIDDLQRDSINSVACVVSVLCYLWLIRSIFRHSL